MRTIIRAASWKGFRELVEELGGSADEILAAAHVDATLLNQPDRYLPLRLLIDTLNIAAERLERSDFGLLWGSRLDVSMLGALAIAITNAPTAREALDIATRFLHTHSPAIALTVSPLPNPARDFVRLDTTIGAGVRADQYHERTLAITFRALQQICGPGFRPVETWFAHARQSPMAAYRRVFGAAPLFGKTMMGLVVDRAVLDAPRSGLSPQLRDIAETFLRSLGPPRDDTVTARVASIVRGLRGGPDSSAAQAALALGMHERTLQRRLKAEGTTFEVIRDTVRRDIAESLLAQNVALSQIAFALDYSDLSAFSRSSRRWFGRSPSAHRAELLKRTIQPPPRSPRRTRSRG
jgi:AraC-like DNA-binding protein